MVNRDIKTPTNLTDDQLTEFILKKDELNKEKIGLENRVDELRKERDKLLKDIKWLEIKFIDYRKRINKFINDFREQEKWVKREY